MVGNGRKEMEEEILITDDSEPPSTGLAFGSCLAKNGCFPAKRDREKKRAKVTHLRRVVEVSKFRVSPAACEFRKTYFPKTSQTEWDDWHWQLKNRITSLTQLAPMIRLSLEESEAINRYSRTLPLAVTPYYASLLEKDNPLQPIRRAVIPVTAEQQFSTGEASDPLGEDNDSPVPGLVHRYPDRALFLVTDFCSTYCRYCTRSRMVGQRSGGVFHKIRLERALAYIQEHREIRDVLLSGGDPLTLSDAKLEWLLTRLKQIPHVEFVRIGTKAPVVLPQRITPALTKMLKRFHPLWISIHFTHPDELTPETVQACERLADAGIPLGSQTVLLKGINDQVDTMKRLVQGLLKTRVRPYYLYQCDPILGSSHLRTTVEKGLEIIRGLRGFTTGYAVPNYVIDAPGGGGKIPLLPEYFMGRDGDDLLLKNYQGRLYRYPDPVDQAIGDHLACKPCLPLVEGATC